MEEIPHQYLSTGRTTGKNLLAQAVKRYEQEKESQLNPKTGTPIPKKGGGHNG